MMLISQLDPSIRASSEIFAREFKISQSWSCVGPAFRVKRGQRLVVAASPPTEEAVIAAEPLTKEDLVAYLASGCKPKDKWKYSF